MNRIKTKYKRLVVGSAKRKRRLKVKIDGVTTEIEISRLAFQMLKEIESEIRLDLGKNIERCIIQEWNRFFEGTYRQRVVSKATREKLEREEKAKVKLQRITRSRGRRARN
jgi:hypothetical protein